MPFHNPFSNDNDDTSAAPRLRPPSFMGQPPRMPKRPIETDYSRVTNPDVLKMNAHHIEQQEQARAQYSHDVASYNRDMARRSEAEASLQQQQAAVEAQARKTQLDQENSRRESIFRSQGRPFYTDKSTGLLTPEQDDQTWVAQREAKRYSDMEVERKSSIQKEIDALDANHSYESLQRPTLSRTDREGIDKDLSSLSRNAILNSLIPKHSQTSKEEDKGWILNPFDNKPTNAANKAKERLAKLEAKSLEGGDLDDDDIKDLESTAPQEAAKYKELKAKLQADEENQKWQQQGKREKAELNLKLNNPDKWAELQKAKVAAMGKEDLEEFGTKLSGGYAEKLKTIETAQASILQKDAEIKAQMDSIIAENDERIKNGIAASELVTTADGKSFHKDSFAKLMDAQQQAIEWEATSASDRLKILAQSKDLEYERSVLSEASNKVASLQEQATSEARKPLKENPFTAPFAEELDRVDAETRSAVSEALTKYPKDSPEQIAALKVLEQNEEARKVELAAKIQEAEKQSEGVYAEVRKGIPSTNLHAYLSGSLEGNQNALAEAQIQKVAQAKGLSVDQVRSILTQMAVFDWTGSNANELARVTKGGEVLVSPDVAFDPDAYKKAVESSGASEEAKKKAMGNMDAFNLQAAEVAYPYLAADPDFQEYIEDESRKAPAFGLLTDAQKAKTYLEGESGLSRVWRDIKLKYAQAGGMLVQGWHGTGALLGSEKAKERMETAQEGVDYAQTYDQVTGLNRRTAGLELPWIGKITAGNFIETAVGSAPAIGVGLALAPFTGGTSALLATAGVAGLQSSGNKFAQVYDMYRKQGLSSDEARSAATMPAIVSGIIEAGITTLFGRTGIESVLSNAASKRVLASSLKGKLGTVLASGLKGFAKHGALEFPEEFTIALLDAAMDMVKVRPDLTWSEAFREATHAGVMGFGLGGVMGGASSLSIANQNTFVQGTPKGDAFVQSEERRIAAEKLNRDVKIAAAKEALQSFDALDVDPDHMQAARLRAEGAFEIAQGNFESLTSDQLNAMGYVREGSGVVPDPSYTGPKVVEFHKGDINKPIILQSYISALRGVSPVIADAIGMDETSARKHFAQEAKPNPPTETSNSVAASIAPQADPKGGAPSSRSASATTSAPSAISSVGENVQDTGSASPADSVSVPNYRRTLSEEETKQKGLIKDWLTARSVDTDHAEQFADYSVRTKGATEDYLVQAVELSKELQQFGGGINAKAVTNNRALVALKQWINEAPLSAPSEPPTPAPQVATTQDLRSQSPQTEDVRSRTEELLNQPARMPVDTQSENWRETRRVAVQGHVEALSRHYRSADPVMRGELVNKAKKAANNAIDSLERHVNRFSPVIPGGFILTSELDPADVSRFNGGGGIAYDPSKKAVVVNLAQFTRQFSSGRKAQADAIEAVVIEELIHHVTTSLMTVKEKSAVFKRLALSSKGREVIQLSWEGYYKNTPAMLDVDPIGYLKKPAEQAAHMDELLRMLIQNSAFRKQVTEAMDVEPSLAQTIIEFLRSFVAQIRSAMKGLPVDVRSDLQKLELQASKALRELVKKADELAEQRKASSANQANPDGVKILNQPQVPAQAPAEATVVENATVELPQEQVDADAYDEEGNPIEEEDDIPFDFDSDLGGAADAELESAGNSETSKPEIVRGNAGVAYTDSNEPIEFQWAAVELDQVTISNFDNGAVNPAYPQELQPRDRSTAKSEDQVNDISRKTNFDRLSFTNLVSDGSPILSEDGVAETGNGRLMGLRRAFDNDYPNIRNYVERFTEKAQLFGIDPESVRSLNQPVLVRIRTSPLTLEQRVAFTQAANVSTVSAMSEVETAKKDALNMKPSLFELFDIGSEGNLAAVSNVDFVRSFVREVVPQAERGAMVDSEGNLSRSGARRVLNALFVAAYGDSQFTADTLAHLTESVEESGKNMASTLVTLAPKIAFQKARMAEGHLHPDLGISEDIIETAAKWAQLRNEGQSVEDFLNQGTFAGMGESIPSTQELLLRHFAEHTRSARKLRLGLERYLSAVEAIGSPNQLSMFGDEQHNKTALLDLALKPRQTDEVLGAGKRFSLKGAYKAFGQLFNRSKTESLSNSQLAAMEKAAEVVSSEIFPETLQETAIIEDVAVEFLPSSATILHERDQVWQSLEDHLASEYDQGRESGMAGNGQGAISSPASRLAALQGRLRLWATDGGRQIEARSFGEKFESRQVANGEEHTVYLDEDAGQVVKVTVGDNYGAKGIDSWLYNIKRSNALFGDDIRLIGVLDYEGSVKLVISQPLRVGEHPTMQEIGGFMAQHGFKRVGEKTFYNPSTEEVVSDAKPANFIKSSEGVVMPIDVHFPIPNDRLKEVYENMINSGMLGAAKRKADPEHQGALRVYQHLTEKAKAGTQLSVNEAKALRNAEAKLGQNFFEFDQPSHAPAEDLVLESETIHPRVAQDQQLTLFSPKRAGFVAPGLYSNLVRVLDAKLPKQSSVQQVLDIANNASSGIKKEEVKWSGLTTYLDSLKQGAVNKAELLDYLENEESKLFKELHIQDGFFFLNDKGDPEIFETESEAEAERKKLVEQKFYERYDIEVDAQKRSFAVRRREDGEAVYRVQRGDDGLWMPLDIGIYDLDFEASDSLLRRNIVQEISQYDGEFGIGEVAIVETEYKNYTLPEYQNYKELVLVGGQKVGPYYSSHYTESRYVAHARLTERMDSDKRRGLFIEEIQSDRHQDGRKKGYVEDTDGTGVNDAPHRKDYALALFKRALREAVEAGKAWVGWTRGVTQVERYADPIRQRVDSIEVKPSQVGPGLRDFYIYRNKYDVGVGTFNANGLIVRSDLSSAEGNSLESLFGKSIAEKLLNPTTSRVEGEDLTIGGEGMKGFYDKMLPSEVRKYIKAWGAEVTVGTLDFNKSPRSFESDLAHLFGDTLNIQSSEEFWKVEITPQMRESVKQGQPLFAASRQEQNLFDFLSSEQKEQKQNEPDVGTRAQAPVRMTQPSLFDSDTEASVIGSKNEPSLFNYAMSNASAQGDLFSQPAQQQVELPTPQAEATAPNDTRLGQESLNLENGAARLKPRPSKPRATETSSPSSDRIEDFGEKLHGARKDLWGKFRTAMEGAEATAANASLATHFPVPNYAALFEAGVPSETLATIAWLRESIPTKKKRFESRYARDINVARALALRILNGETIANEKLAELAPAYNADAGTLKMYQKLGYPYFLDAKEYSIKSFKRSLLDKPSNWGITKGHWFTQDKAPYTDEGFDSLVEKLRETLSAKAAQSKILSKKPIRFDVFTNRRTQETFIGKKGLFEHIKLKGGFKDSREAFTYLKENQAELEQLWSGMKREPALRKTENATRLGPDVRGNEFDVTPQTYMDTFGFRGVQFGNYVEGTRRQSDLNTSFDALMDMARVLDIPPNSISLGGRLGLAFGARGSGGFNAASAHYERDAHVINLTKGSGPGALAHEWFHAFDSYMGRIGYQEDHKAQHQEYVSQSRLPLKNLRTEVNDAWKEVMATIRKSKLLVRSKEADNARTKPYFSTDVELAARSFEAFIIHKLEERGESNDYLANITGFDGLYPTISELEQEGIAAAFDQLFNALQTKSDEHGNTLLFSAARYVPEVTTLNDRPRALVDALVQGATIEEAASDAGYSVNSAKNALKGISKFLVKKADDVSPMEFARDFNEAIRAGQEFHQTTQKAGEYLHKFDAKEGILLAAKRNTPVSEHEEILKNAPRDTLGKLIAPNGQPSNLNEEQYALVRTQAYKDEFGDWEEYFKGNALRGQVVSEIKLGTIQTMSGEKASEAAHRWLNVNPQAPIYRPGIGEVIFDAKSIADTLGHGFSGPKLNALSAVKDVIEQGAMLDESMDFEGKPLRNWVIAAPVSLDGKRHTMFARIRKDIADPKSSHRFYVHEVVLEDHVANEETSPFKFGSDPEVFRGKKSGGTGFYLSLARRALSVKPQAVRIPLDSNGEPVLDGQILGAAKRSASWSNNEIDKALVSILGKGIKAVASTDRVKAVTELVANSYNGDSLPANLVQQVIKFTQKQLVPNSLIPREARALLTEMKLKQVMGNEKALDLHRSLTGKAKFDDMRYPPGFANDAKAKRQLFMAMAGEIEMSKLPRPMQDLAGRLRAILAKAGRDAVTNGRMSSDTYAALMDNYMPHFFEDPVCFGVTFRGSGGGFFRRAL